MKKITLVAALLGSAYFANAQVGIGTPTPSDATMLHIDANNKGVIIPNVKLQSTTDTDAVVGTELESLLVYNTGADNDVTPGFYYWVAASKTTPVVPAHWERVVNQTQLNEVIESQADISKIKELLNAAYGSNNLGDAATNNPFGGMVFTPAVGQTPAKFEFVKWVPNTANPTTGAYERQDITSVITDLIEGSENKTMLLTTSNKKKQYYISETYLADSGNPAVTQAVVDAWTSLPAGVYEINFIEGVSTNIQTILDQTVTIEKDGKSFTTVEQYIQYIASKSDANVGFTVGGIAAADNSGTAIPANSFYYINQTTGNKVHIDLASLVQDLETDTKITKNETGTLADGDLKIEYKYFNEAQPDTTGTPQQTIDVQADLKKIIEGNTEIKNAISNVLNAGGNVYYGEVNGTNVFYTINAAGDKVTITIPVNIDQLITSINSATVEKKNELKLALGDKITANNTSVFTGDTITINGVLHYVYKGNFITTVNANSAVTTGVTLDKSAAKVLSLDLRYNGGLVANVTNMNLNGSALAFNIGVGNMYQVLGTTEVNAEAFIEFASTEVPAGVTTTP